MTRITVLRSGLAHRSAAIDERVVADGEVRRWAITGQIVKHVGRYRSARLLTERLATSGRPMLAWALRVMARGRCYIADTEGRERDVTLPLLLRWSWQVAREAVGKRALFRAIERRVEALEREPPPRRQARHVDGQPLYLRTDLSFGVRAGGSVGHIAGVANELARAERPPILVSTSLVPTLSPDVELHQIAVPERFWNFQELPTLVLNDVCIQQAREAIGNRPLSFVYQRYSLNNFAGLRLSRDLGVPFVLEYNGSEIWMSRRWSRPLKYEAIASRIELLNVRAADLVVVVSRAMRDELVGRGVDSDRLLVNANAVDPDRYHPAVSGACVRARYRLGDATVLGFISTFAPWHGAVILARAFAALLRHRPDYRRTVRLLMIGDGPEEDACRRIIGAAGLSDVVVFTGLVRQDDGPRHLAACDIFVSPHVPNPDGTPFFGSPTKLFEYMAMGRGIVASNLDQIGEVLRHGETAWLVPPADVDALAEGLDRLICEPALRQRLGITARRDALTHHTWQSHVRRTLDALAVRAHRQNDRILATTPCEPV